MATFYSLTNFLLVDSYNITIRSTRGSLTDFRIMQSFPFSKNHFSVYEIWHNNVSITTLQFSSQLELRINFRKYFNFRKYKRKNKSNEKTIKKRKKSKSFLGYRMKEAWRIFLSETKGCSERSYRRGLSSIPRSSFHRWTRGGQKKHLTSLYPRLVCERGLPLPRNLCLPWRTQ